MGCAAGRAKVNQESTAQRSRDQTNINEKPASARASIAIPEADLTTYFVFSSKELGHGQFGSIREARLVNDSTARMALKSILKSRLPDRFIQSEADIWSRLDHPYIARFYGAVQDSQYFHLLVELCEGGDLAKKVSQFKGLEESECQKFFLQVVLSVDYLHQQGIAHRDLKLNNFLLKDKSAETDIRMVDFGFSHPEGTQTMNDAVGTLRYLAPEVFSGNYTLKADIWSLGVMLYVMVSNQFPYELEIGSTPKAKIVQMSKIHFDGQAWKRFNPAVQDLIKKLLEHNSEKRPTCQEILAHPWLEPSFGRLCSQGQQLLPKDWSARLKEVSGVENPPAPLVYPIRQGPSPDTPLSKNCPSVYIYLCKQNPNSLTYSQLLRSLKLNMN